VLASHFELKSELRTGILEEIMSDLHNTAGMLDDGNIGALEHFQCTILKAIDGLKHS
jgi:hypothetical protein